MQVLLAMAKKRYPHYPILSYRLTNSGVVGFIKYNFATGPGITGWVMWASLGVMVWFAREKSRRVDFERCGLSFFLCYEAEVQILVLSSCMPSTRDSL